MHADSTLTSKNEASKPSNSCSDFEQQGFVSRLIGDGRPLLSLTGLALLLSGAFALFLSATGAFLPHDVEFLGMTPQQLCSINECRIVHFMFHDRAAFGGTLIAIGILYLWLSHFPIAAKQEWAWWVFAISSALGFVSFLSYLGYGYLDTWHGAATLALLPCSAIGLWKSRGLFAVPRQGPRSLFSPVGEFDWRTPTGLGRICLLLTGLGKVGAGLVISIVGMTAVFVPQDLEFLGLNPDQMFKINPRLVPLIAHDRAGFGGGLIACGVIVAFTVWKCPITRSLWQALLAAGTAGFACAIGVHYCIGYTDFIHLAPALLGSILFASGMILTAKHNWPLPASKDSLND